MKASKKFLPSFNAGFTLIELLVVLAIFVIVTSVVLFQYGNLRSSSSLSNLATDISLSIRRAQSYAIGASNSGYLGSNFSFAYGVHFSADPVPVAVPQNGSNKSFIMFTDVSKDGMYTENSPAPVCNQQNLTVTSECTEMLTISTADQISKITFTNSSGTTQVPAGGVMDIMFLRPNPDAFFCYRSNPSSNICNSSTGISSVTIEISSLNIANGVSTKDITVWSTGQISVQ